MSADPYRIDSHKLLFHPRRVADWLEGEPIAPIYMEVSPSGACNHRCVFCGLDFMGYKPRFLPTDIFIEKLNELGKIGVKSIMYAGEGEPFLHKDMANITLATKNAGIDVAFTTNATLLKPEIAEQILPVTSWIKVSCNAGSRESYAKIHGTKAQDFDTVLGNMAKAVTIRKNQKSACTLGFQMVLLPENQDEAVTLAQKVRDIGADYLVIKPYSIHRQSNKNDYKELQYGDCLILAKELLFFNTDTFKVIFRHQAMQRRENPTQIYTKCLALPFWGYIDSGGTMWGCLRHINEENFNFGNMLTTPIRELIFEKVRQEKIMHLKHTIIKDCHIDCRMDTINAYLWELKHPHGHVNFV